jgi:Secretion system C-terminal sorting domain
MSKRLHFRVKIVVTVIVLFSCYWSIYCQDGPLGEWPDFTPLGYITAPHPQNPNVQTHLYGDWGGIVGEEFLVIQDDMLKLFYHSYHGTYMTQHSLDDNLLSDWELGYDLNTYEKFEPLASPGGQIPGSAWSHTDTPGYIQHPITGEHLLYNTTRPGTMHLHPEWSDIPGWIGAIQVATSDFPPQMGVPFEQNYENILSEEFWWEQGWNQNGLIKGGLSEPTPVWVPHLGENGKIRLFYRGLHSEPGSYYNWRISYADSEDGKTNWIKNSVPFWDPSVEDNPAYEWTQPYPQGFSFRGAWQAHCTGDTIADGVHMVMSVSSQNYAGYGHIAYYWSPDWGDTWIGHPDNPIIAPGQHENGVPAQGFQRTPAMVVDNESNRYILAYNAGHDINESWRRRTYIATADRPQVASQKETVKDIIIAQNYPNPFNPATSIEFTLSEGQNVAVNIFNIKGEKKAELINSYLSAGKHRVDFNGRDLSSGIYFYKIESERVQLINKMILLK